MNTVGWRETVRDRCAVGRAARVAVIVGSILFLINHGPALATSEMSLSRWVSAVLTYSVPFIVNLHGQMVGRGRAVSSSNDG